MELLIQFYNLRKLGIQVKTCIRYAVKAPDSREKWRLVRLPISDSACAKAGYNVIGPAMDHTALNSDERQELLELSQTLAADMTKEGAQRLSVLLSRMPRLTVPGYDIDGSDPEVCNEIAKRLWKAEAARGVVLRAAKSSGSAGAGIHLEFSRADDMAKSPDLLRTMLRRAGMVAEEAGLVPQVGSNVSIDGVPLFWTLKELADTEGKGVPRLDFTPLNHSHDSRQRLFRPLGGLNKAGTARKSLVPGSVAEGSPITLSILSEAPAAKQVRKSKDTRTKKKVVFEPIKVSSSIKPIVDVLKDLTKAGFHHELRLALNAVAQTKNVLGKEAWVSAMAAAWGDPIDAEAAWTSTENRLRVGQPCRGANWLRKRIGWKATWRLIEAISQVSLSDISAVAQRFGRPVVDKAAIKPLWDAIEDHRLVKRLRTAGRCLQYEHKADCKGCGDTQYTKRLRCDWLELCPACHAKSISTLSGWLSAKWSENKEYVLYETPAFPSRGHALDWLTKRLSKSGHGEKPIKIPFLTEDGYKVLAIAPDDCRGATTLSFLAASSDFNNGGTIQHEVNKNVAVRKAVATVAMRFTWAQELIELEKWEEAGAYLTDIYCSHRAYGGKAAAVPWPTQADLASVAQEMVDKSELCDCPFDIGEVHTYKHCPTGFEVVTVQGYPKSFHEVIGIHRQAQCCGRAPGDIERVVERVVVRRE